MAFTQFTETTPATGAEAIFNLKTILKAAGWGVSSSSDGTTYNAVGDQITSPGAGAGGMANNNAWVRMRNTNNVGMTIQRGTTNTVWRVKFSPIAGFTGGSPSATQTPNAADEGILLGGGTDAAPTFEALFGTDGTYRHKAGADNATPFHFWSGAFPTGGGNQNHAFVFEGLAAVEPTDGAPFHVVIGNTQLNATNLVTEGESGASSRSFATLPAVTPTTAGWTVFGALAYQAVATVAPNALPTNPITGRDESLPIAYARRAAISLPGWKGIGTMMRWTGTSRTTGDTLTVSTARDRIVFDSVSFPWNGNVPTV